MSQAINDTVNHIKDVANVYAPRLREIRRFLHRRPEVSGSEYATTEFLSELVSDLGLTPQIAEDRRGLCVDMGQTSTLGRIAIRGDIDALPIQTELSTDYASRNAGVMHACGHDAHATMVLGALTIIHDLVRDNLLDSAPAVRAILQPDEETSRGGLHMIRSGALEGIAAAISLHVEPAMPVGAVGVRTGVLTAGCDSFEVRISGQGGHGARPHLTSDTIGAAAQWVTDTYRRVPRGTDARDAVVINVGKFESGTAPNVVPAEAVLAGTLRSLTNEGRESAHETMQAVSESISAVHRCEVELTFHQYTPPVVNHPAITSIVETAAVAHLGIERVRIIDKPSMGAEDFAFMAERVPSSMFRLGVAGIDVGNHPLHTPSFDIDEDSLPIGASILALAAIQWHHHQSTVVGNHEVKQKS